MQLMHVAMPPQSVIAFSQVPRSKFGHCAGHPREATLSSFVVRRRELRLRLRDRRVRLVVGARPGAGLHDRPFAFREGLDSSLQEL
jgi:hypothetical protein